MTMDSFLFFLPHGSFVLCCYTVAHRILSLKTADSLCAAGECLGEMSKMTRSKALPVRLSPQHMVGSAYRESCMFFCIFVRSFESPGFEGVHNWLEPNSTMHTSSLAAATLSRCPMR